MRRMLLMLAVAATAVALTGCTITINTPPAATQSQSGPTAPDSASPAPTEQPGPAVFESIDGTWCPADGSTDCMTIALPDVSVGGAAATETIGEVTDNEDATPCFSTYIAEKATGMGEVGVFYCPKGVSPAKGVNGEHDDPSYDRLYLTQNPPDVDVWFREADLDAALGR
jgi:hypothetical protein